MQPQYSELLKGPKKRCSLCDEFKPLSEFYRNKKTRDGHGYACKPCLRVYNREYVEKNREKVNAGKRRRYNPVQARRYRFRTREHRSEVNKKWSKANPRSKEKRQELKSKRQERMDALPHTMMRQDERDAKAYFGGCAVCGYSDGDQRTITLAHWIAITDKACPGTVPENMVPLCNGRNGCNQKKSNRHPEIWLELEYGYDKAQEILSRIESFLQSVRTT